MAYHIVMSKPFDLEDMERQAQLGISPRHAMSSLSQKLGAQVHQPKATSVSLQDKLLARIIGQSEHWALAREIVAKANDGDVVFCTGEDVGLPLAIVCRMRRKQLKIAVSVMAPDRLRVRTCLKAFQLAGKINLFLTNTGYKSKYLNQNLAVTEQQVYQFPEQTDETFFSPGPVSQAKVRPLIFSAGLEQRDYQTLADAVQTLPIDVKVCAISPNASKRTTAVLPKVLPPNMTLKLYEWADFRQMYRDADVVVISLLQNNYSAGLTSLMEAIACRRPTIITRTPGLVEELIAQHIVVGVDPGDAAGLQQAIQQLLANPQAAEAMAQRAYEYFLGRHTSRHFTDRLAERLKRLQETVIEPDLDRGDKSPTRSNWDLKWQG